MKVDPITLDVVLVQDECCSLCNPVRLADYEQPCVRVHRADCLQGGFYVCLDCIGRLKQAVLGVPSRFALPLEVSRFMRELMRQSGVDPDETVH